MADIDSIDEEPQKKASFAGRSFREQAFNRLIPQPLILFGRDVSAIPCFRESFLYGIGSGVVIGLGAFMSTSKPRLATHVGVSSYIMITLSFWCYCR